MSGIRDMSRAADYAPPREALGLLPVGMYRLEVFEIGEEQDTKAGNGNKRVPFVYRVVEGEYEGAKIFINFNTVNQSEIAVRRAYAELRDLAAAVGNPLTGDADRMLNKTFWAKVGVEKSKDSAYGDKNRIDKYIPQDGAPLLAAPAPTSPPPAKLAPAAGGSAPWRR